MQKYSARSPRLPASVDRQGMLGTDGRLLAPGIFDVTPLVALLTAHDARMSVACCATYPCSMLVALGSGRLELPANDAAAVDITLGSLNADGLADAGLGT
jgi:hypothetical protein